MYGSLINVKLATDAAAALVVAADAAAAPSGV